MTSLALSRRRWMVRAAWTAGAWAWGGAARAQNASTDQRGAHSQPQSESRPEAQLHAQSPVRSLADLAPDADALIPLWHGPAPGGEGVMVRPTVEWRGPQNPSVSGIVQPALALYRPAKPDGSAVMLIPGGGYRHLASGPGLARWLAQRGAHACVLLYRLPQDGWALGPDVVLQDVQRGMRQIRARAAEWKVDPARVAVHGASAGGHAAGQLMARFDHRTHAPLDALDELSARPALAGLGYPVITFQGPHAHAGSRQRLLGAAAADEALRAHYSIEAQVRTDMPPTFLVHAADDTVVPVENSLMMFAALRRQQVPAALHVFQEGGHGFALGTRAGGGLAAWPDLFWQWGQRHGVFRGA